MEREIYAKEQKGPNGETGSQKKESKNCVNNFAQQVQESDTIQFTDNSLQ